MEAAHTVIWAMSPVIVVFLLGFFGAKFHGFTKEMAETLNELVMRYTLPLTLFVGTVETSRSVIVSDVPLFLSFLFVFGILFFIIYWLSRIILKFDMAIAALFAVTATIPGVPFIGPSVLQYMFGTEGIVAVSISSLVINVIAVPAAIIFITIARNSNDKNINGIPEKLNLKLILNQIFEAVKLPVVWLPALGFILVLFEVKVPKLLDNSLALLGVATGGVSLFASGIVLSLDRMKINKFVVLSVIFKNIIQPLILWVVLISINANQSTIKESVITTAIPTVSLSVMIALKFNKGQTDTATAAFISTILSIITMGIFIYLLKVST